MALRYLVDTSVLTRLANPHVRQIVEPLAAGGALGRAGICDLEVGYAARDASAWDHLVGALDVFVSVDTTTAHVHRALTVQRMLTRRSQRGRKIPDLLIAAAAEERDLAVLHYDADFDLIASVTGQRCRWVVPAGTVQ